MPRCGDSFTEKTSIPFPIKLNRIWSWWQFIFRFWTKWKSIWLKIERKTVTKIISHSYWQEMEWQFSQRNVSRPASWDKRHNQNTPAKHRTWGNIFITTAALWETHASLCNDGLKTLRTTVLGSCRGFRLSLIGWPWLPRDASLSDGCSPDRGSISRRKFAWICNFWLSQTASFLFYFFSSFFHISTSFFLQLNSESC